MERQAVYGMIHQAARDMAVAHLGEAEWEALAASHGLSGHHFIGVDYYSDADTLSLVNVISKRLSLPIDQALYEFGRFWITFAGASAYGRVLRMAGDDLESFIENLDRMHASIKSNMPLASLPSFQVLESDSRHIQVLYVSERDGLEPFVQGILSAVAERFDESVTIDYGACPDGVVFEITRIIHDA